MAARQKGKAYFDGTGDYLTIPNSTDFDFGSGDFTIDGWFYFLNVTKGYQGLIDRRGSSDGTGWMFFIESDNTVTFLSAQGTAWDNIATSRAFVPTINTWTHIAVVRYGNVFTMYKDGVSVKTGTSTYAIGAQTVAPTIGCGHIAPIPGFDGYIDKLRISKGRARYTSNFTPPTSFDVDGADVVLCMQFVEPIGSKTFIDETGKTVTTYGDVVIVA